MRTFKLIGLPTNFGGLNGSLRDLGLMDGGFGELSSVAGIIGTRGFPRLARLVLCTRHHSSIYVGVDKLGGGDSNGCVCGACPVNVCNGVDDRCSRHRTFLSLLA